MKYFFISYYDGSCPKMGRTKTRLNRFPVLRITDQMSKNDWSLITWREITEKDFNNISQVSGIKEFILQGKRNSQKKT